MSSSTYRNNISRINSQIADLMKKQAGERKREVDISLRINDLSKKMLSSKSISTIQNYQRQIDSKSRELVRFQQKTADYEKKIADKRKELLRDQGSLEKAIENENKARRNEELKFLKQKESINRSELSSIRSYNSELLRQQTVFNNYEVSEEQLISGDSDYSLKELAELQERIDSVLAKLEKLGFGQEIIFDEIEELKKKSKKISKKDLKMMLLGKIVSFGMGKISPELAAEMFEEITKVDLKKLVE